MAADELLSLDRRREWESAKRSLRSALRSLNELRPEQPLVVDGDLAARLDAQDRWLKARIDAARAKQDFGVFADAPRTPLMLKGLTQQYENYCRAWAAMSMPARHHTADTKRALGKAVERFSRDVAKKYGKNVLVEQMVLPAPYVPPMPPDFPFAAEVHQWPPLIAAGEPATWTDPSLLRAFYLYCRLLAGLSYAVDEQTRHILEYTEYADFAGEVSWLGLDERRAHRSFYQACVQHGRQ
ncbi:hypothetical protein [Streptomyces sp. NPDC086023]|uniref:hypothetical protein n=1 Tax=Streptomyces sp. NPDC086023 TaxID=3365746 RepID=UPI0037D42EA1